MARGKIEIKKIENPTNRQVTYSKRRNGLFKKAQELTVLCDAQVSLIMISASNKVHEYTSPNTTTKKMYDKYQKALGIDLWNTHYERLEAHLRKLMNINNKLRSEIRHRMGHDLKDVSLDEIRILEPEMTDALATVRERKYHVIKTQTNTCQKKVRNLEQRHGNLLMGLEAKCEDVQHFGLVDSEGGYNNNSSVSYASGVTSLYSYRLQSDGPELHLGGGF